jgi:RimJ/RimL family protein N-acetyltransferase
MVVNSSFIDVQDAGVREPEFESRSRDNEGFEIRLLTRHDRKVLAEMYRGFEPLGAAMGLPPTNEERRVDWIDRALEQQINLGAFSPAGDLVGHCFLAASDIHEAELAIFVRQEFRRQGIGFALVKRTLRSAAQEKLQRVWAIVGVEDLLVQRMLARNGFGFSQYALPAVEFDITLLSKI